MKRWVTSRNRLAVAHLVEILHDVITTGTTFPDLTQNNTDFMVILLLGFINPVATRESIISVLLSAVIYVRYMYVSPNTQQSTLTAVAYWRLQDDLVCSRASCRFVVLPTHGRVVCWI